MQPNSKRAGGIAADSTPVVEDLPAPEIKATESDDEYEDVPTLKKAGKPRASESARDAAPPATVVAVPEKPLQDDAENAPVYVEESQPPAPAPSKGATDDEWLRSRTSRVLDLLDDDDEPPPLKPPAPAQGDNEHGADAQMTGTDANHEPAEAAQPDAPEVEESASEPQKEEEKAEDAEIQTIRKTARLFVRNLPYSATEDDLNDHFGQYGPVEEVRTRTSLPFFPQGRYLPHSRL